MSYVISDAFEKILDLEIFYLLQVFVWVSGGQSSLRALILLLGFEEFDFHLLCCGLTNCPNSNSLFPFVILFFPFSAPNFEHAPLKLLALPRHGHNFTFLDTFLLKFL